MGDGAGEMSSASARNKYRDTKGCECTEDSGRTDGGGDCDMGVVLFVIEVGMLLLVLMVVCMVVLLLDVV